MNLKYVLPVLVFGLATVNVPTQQSCQPYGVRYVPSECN